MWIPHSPGRGHRQNARAGLRETSDGAEECQWLIQCFASCLRRRAPDSKRPFPAIQDHRHLAMSARTAAHIERQVSRYLPALSDMAQDAFASAVYRISQYAKSPAVPETDLAVRSPDQALRFGLKAAAEFVVSCQVERHLRQRPACAARDATLRQRVSHKFVTPGHHGNTEMVCTA